MKEEKEKKEKIEQMSKEEMEIDLLRKKEIIENTEKLLKFSTDRYKEIHRGMMLSEILKERDIAANLIKEKQRKEKIKEQESDLIYLDRIRKEKEKDILEKIKKDAFEKEWSRKREEQIEEKKMKAKREFQEEVDDLERKRKILDDEIKKERKLQEIEELERTTKKNIKKEDMEEKCRQRQKELKEDDEAFTQMYEVQKLHDDRKVEHQEILKNRQERISKRQQVVFNKESERLRGLKDETDEKIAKYIEEHDRKKFNENLLAEEKIKEKKMKEQEQFNLYQREKQMKRERELQLMQEENSLHKQRLRDMHDDVKKKKEASDQAHKKLANFWSKQRKESEEKRKNQIHEDKHRLFVTLKGYNEEDDKLEQYVNDLLLEENKKDLNLHPIIKAKKSLYLGRQVQIISYLLIINQLILEVFQYFHPMEVRLG